LWIAIIYQLRIGLQCHIHKVALSLVIFALSVHTVLAKFAELFTYL